MKYVVEYRNKSYNVHWDKDEEFGSLSDAIEYAKKESADNPRMQHRIVKVHDVEQVMFFASTEEQLAVCGIEEDDK